MVQVYDRNGTAVIEVRGDVDIYTADDTFNLVQTASAGKTQFVLSLEFCPYCDSSGLAHVARMIREGKRFVVVARDQVRRVFELTNFHTRVPVVATVAEAVQLLAITSTPFAAPPG